VTALPRVDFSFVPESGIQIPLLLDPHAKLILSAMVVLFGKKWLWVLVATTCTLRSGVAFAEPFHEDPPDEAASTEPSSERWYGWQTLSLDVIPTGIFVAGLATAEDDTTFWLAGSAVFAVGGPAVHLVHERPLVALASLGLRTGLPALGVAIGMAFTDNSPPPDMPGVEHQPDEGIQPFLIGGLTGVATASFLDAAFLAYDTSSEHARSSETSASNLGVSFGVAPGGGRITVLGAF
jgi:hypothetical protein